VRIDGYTVVRSEDGTYTVACCYSEGGRHWREVADEYGGLTRVEAERVARQWTRSYQLRRRARRYIHAALRALSCVDPALRDLATDRGVDLTTAAFRDEEAYRASPGYHYPVPAPEIRALASARRAYSEALQAVCVLHLDLPRGGRRVRALVTREVARG